jgi:hypothetical protein
LAHGLAPRIIPADAAEDCRMVAETASHDGEVCRGTAEARPLRQDVPQQLAYSKDKSGLFQAFAPVCNGDSSQRRASPSFARTALSLRRVFVNPFVNIWNKCALKQADFSEGAKI